MVTRSRPNFFIYKMHIAWIFVETKIELKINSYQYKSSGTFDTINFEHHNLLHTIQPILNFIQKIEKKY